MLQVKQEFCIGCGVCIRSCPTGAITLSLNKAHIDSEKCIGCNNCISICPQGAIEVVVVTEIDELKSKMQVLQEKIKLLSKRLDNLTKRKRGII